MFQSDVYYSFLLFGFLKLLKRHMSSKENSLGFCVVIVAKETISSSLQCMGHLCHTESATERHITSGLESEGGRNIKEQNRKLIQIELLLNNTLPMIFLKNIYKGKK